MSTAIHNRSPSGSAGPTRPAPEQEAEYILARLAERRSTRDFAEGDIDETTIDAIIRDGIEAPSDCNHQMWHFVVVRDLETKARMQEISGSNSHFVSCSAMIVLCFHMGWNHNKFAVVQSVAAAAYHMSLSAHLRGLAVVWNAGIGDKQKVKDLLGIPPQFEILGTLCLGYKADSALAMKPPRRPLESIRSYECFERPSDEIYPLKQARRYIYHRMLSHRNKYSVFNPDVWGWDRIGNFRSYAVYAKSPLPGVYVSRRLGKEMDVELDAIGEVAPGSRILELMPYGGSYTVRLLSRFGANAAICVAELSSRNLDFVRERVCNEGMPSDQVRYDLMPEGVFPYPDESFDVVFLPQILEAVPKRDTFLAEVHRVLKTGGRLALTLRNMYSWFGLYYVKVAHAGQVPNFGPYIPRSPFGLRRVLADRFEVETDFGVSPSPTRIGHRANGPLRWFSRLYATRLKKT